MEERKFTYIIVGGGLAGASAVTGIRENDPDGTILLVGDESIFPMTGRRSARSSGSARKNWKRFLSIRRVSTMKTG